jgi:hypothetical protein
VPRQQAGTIEPVMQRMGFKRDDDRLAHFYRDI